MIAPLARDWFPYLPTAFRYGTRFFWMPEQDGHQDDTAPGETFHTSWGIIQDTWDDAVRKGIVRGNLADATQAQAGNILLSEFFNAMRLSMLPTAVAFVLFCDSTLTGTGHVAALLQRTISMPDADIDGVIGDKTLAATGAWLDAHGQAALVDALIEADLTYLAELENAPKYINGWRRRELEEQAIAHDIIADEGTVETVVAGVPVPPLVAAALPIGAAVPMVTTQLPVAAVPAIAPLVFGEGTWVVTIRRAT